MAWVYRIEELKTETKFGETYVLVHFWPDRASFAAGRPPTIIESFIMQLRPTGRRMVTDEQGRTLRESGKWASPRAPNITEDPPVYEEVAVDVRREIKGNIERFIDKMKHVKGDLSDPRIKTDTSDPKGILAKPEVAALYKQDFDEPARSDIGDP